MHPKRTASTKETKDCRECGKTFTRYACNASGDFCTYPCWIQWRRKNGKPRMSTCEWCGIEFANRPTGPKLRFCGKKCSGRFHSAKFTHHSYACANCAKEFERRTNPGRLARQTKVFCSPACYKAGRVDPIYTRHLDESSGYIVTKLPDGEWTVEHRVIAEQVVVCRPLADDEVVHHVNEVKTDNDPSNLWVMDRASHMRLHRELERSRKSQP